VNGTLSPLQRRILRALAHLDWTLTGGGALAGFHLGHRTTRDLDLFWMGVRDLDRVPAEVERRLIEDGLVVDRLQASPGFVRLRVASSHEAIPIDLVAEPMPAIEAPIEPEPGIRVDTRFAILVHELGALLSRWAVRDLVDVRALLEDGQDFERALLEAGKRDGGFSPQTLAWVLDTAPETGLDDGLRAFRADLVRRLLA
jgi:hypothetical protein